MEQLCLFEEEEWRDVQGYEGLYQVSNLGNVKSLDRKTTWNEENILTPWVQNGYPFVRLCKDGKTKTFSIHRLVAIAFIPNPLKLPMVNHKDETRNNNHVENLEWCDAQYNNTYGTARQRSAEKQSIAIEQLTTDGLLVKRWKSIMDAGRSGFSIGHICHCCQGKRHSHKGYVWRYA